MMPTPDAASFRIGRSFRVPGLGLLVLPIAPAPDWLAQPALHTSLALRLHRAGQPPLPLPATIEELAHDDQAPTRALLLDADPGGPLPEGALLELLHTVPNELL
jgi:hypothetical protein